MICRIVSVVATSTFIQKDLIKSCQQFDIETSTKYKVLMITWEASTLPIER